MSSKVELLAGQRFGRWTVLRELEQRNPHGDVVYECLCDCGSVRVVTGSSLIHGRSKSCGCLKRKHGGTHSRLYKIWKTMKDRCYSVNRTNYPHYGGRGITVCDEWKNDFSVFRDWALSNGYTEELTLDRIDVNGNYCPENCRWATWLEQKNNMRTNRHVECNGESHTVAEWSRITGIPYTVLIGRLQRGWEIERALTEPFHSEKAHNINL